MTVHLVMRIKSADPKYFGRALSREDIAFPVVPQIGDGVIWHGDWGVETCVYRYVGPDYIEVGLAPCNERDVDNLIQAGWRLS